MFSVIIPTMWRPKNFINILRKLNEVPLIGEIILIDNTDNKKKITDIPKLIHILEGQNTYVNPAWNRGVRLSRYDKLCILNDDIWFELGLFEAIYPYVNQDFGMIGMDEDNYKNPKKEIALEEVDRPNFGYGCLFFIHKSKWVEIPEGIKIWKGDDWLFFKNGGPNYQLQGFKINGKISETCSDPEFRDIIKKDIEFFTKNNF